MFTGSWIGDLFCGKRCGFLDGTIALHHDADDLVVKELLLELLSPIGRADHRISGILSAAVLHHLPADGSTAYVQLVFFHYSPELRNIALLHGGSGTHNGQQVKVQIIETGLLFCRERREAFRGGSVVGTLVPGVCLKLLQCVQHQKTGALFGAAVILNLQKNLDCKA